MSALIPEYFHTSMVKKVTFTRMPSNTVSGYKVFAKYYDDNYSSGFRKELIDEISNDPPMNPPLKKITLDYIPSATWELPKDAFLDTDHWFRLYFNELILSQMHYNYNRVLRWFSLNTTTKKYTSNDKIELEYYQDVIVRRYLVNDDCLIKIEPVYSDSFLVGTHNVII